MCRIVFVQGKLANIANHYSILVTVYANITKCNLTFGLMFVQKVSMVRIG